MRSELDPGTPVLVIGTSQQVVEEARHDALAVPVSAIMDGPGGKPSVRVLNGADADQLRPVQLGLVADGWVEITEGLEASTEVRLPG